MYPVSKIQGKHLSIELVNENSRQLFEGKAHLLVTLTENCYHIFTCDTRYSNQRDRYKPRPKLLFNSLCCGILLEPWQYKSYEESPVKKVPAINTIDLAKCLCSRYFWSFYWYHAASRRFWQRGSRVEALACQEWA